MCICIYIYTHTHAYTCMHIMSCLELDFKPKPYPLEEGRAGGRHAEKFCRALGPRAGSVRLEASRGFEV